MLSLTLVVVVESKESYSWQNSVSNPINIFEYFSSKAWYDNSFEVEDGKVSNPYFQSKKVVNFLKKLLRRK